MLDYLLLCGCLEKMPPGPSRVRRTGRRNTPCITPSDMISRIIQYRARLYLSKYEGKSRDAPEIRLAGYPAGYQAFYIQYPAGYGKMGNPQLSERSDIRPSMKPCLFRGQKLSYTVKNANVHLFQVAYYKLQRTMLRCIFLQKAKIV